MQRFFAVRFVILILVSMGAVSAAAGQAANPEAVLSSFLKLDFDGARLDSDGFKKVFPLTDWKDAPGYDSSVIVRGYKLGQPSVRANSATIVVTYDVVGFIGGNTMWEAYNEKAPTETFKDQVRVRYELVTRNGKWKVHGPDVGPHISVDVALKNEEELLAGSASDSAEHKSYQRIVDALRKLSGKVIQTHSSHGGTVMAALQRRQPDVSSWSTDSVLPFLYLLVFCTGRSDNR